MKKEQDQMPDSTNRVNDPETDGVKVYKPNLLVRFYLKLSGGRGRLEMKDFPGGWTDMVYVESLIKMSFMERVKLLFLGRVILYNYILCENEPGKTKAITQCFVGTPLDDIHYGLPKGRKPD